MDYVTKNTLIAEWLRRFTSSRVRRLGREFIWISLGQAAAVLGAIVGVRLLTELMDPSTYGQLALGMTVATLVQQVVLGPLSNGAIRFYAPAREADALRGYLSAVGHLVLRATGGIVLAAFVLCLGLALAGQSRWIGLSAAAVCFALLTGYNSVLNGIQNAARQRAIVALHQGFASWGRFLLAAGLVLWLGANSTVAMTGYGLAILIVLISQVWFFHRTLLSGTRLSDISRTPPDRWKKEIFTYTWPIAVWGIPTWAQLVSSRWALQLFSSTEGVGLYTVLYQLGYYPMSLASGLMLQLLAPVLFQRVGDASSTQRMEQVYVLNRQLIYITLGLTALGFVTAAVLHDLAFDVFVAPEYASVAYLLPWMLLAGGLFAAGQTASLNLMSSLESKSLMLPKVATAAFGIGLSCLGAALFGIPGVVAASVLFGAAYLIWTLAVMVIKHRQFIHSTNAKMQIESPSGPGVNIQDSL